MTSPTSGPMSAPEPREGAPKPALSVVIPMYNEIDNVEPMVARVHRGLADYEGYWELICVDDGSYDGTGERLAQVAERYGPHARVIRLRRNFGQTAAMQAGFDAARGELIATLDGDLQNDPADIPRMVDGSWSGTWTCSRAGGAGARTICCCASSLRASPTR